MTSYNIGVSFAPFSSKMPMEKLVLGTCLIPIASGPLSESEWHDTYYTEPYRLAIFMLSLDIKQQKRDHMSCHQAILTLARKPCFATFAGVQGVSENTDTFLSLPALVCITPQASLGASFDS